jgi:acetate---CoA ligase (ADP-forming)
VRGGDGIGFLAATHRSRTGPAADLEALADTLVRVSFLAMHLEGHLAELDINPLMVLPSGQGVKAADGLVVFREP